MKYVVLKNLQVVIWSYQGNEWIYGSTQLFFLEATHFGKNALKTVKLLESKHFESLSKDKNGYVAENRS